MSPTEEANLEAARRYLDALSRGAMAEALEMYTEDVVQEEFPNRLMPNGARRGIAELREGAKRGAQVMAAQRWEIRGAVPAGDTVALEVLWTGTLAIPLGSLAAGDEMRAHFAVFLQFRDGLIAAQRNYDCFDPF